MLNKQDKFLPQQQTQYNLVNEGPFYIMPVSFKPGIL